MPNSLPELTKESRLLSFRLGALPHFAVFASKGGDVRQASNALKSESVTLAPIAFKWSARIDEPTRFQT